ncbi:hypothetical protein TNCV_1127341 [Trichonephila clavipes]|nr:hypothetical protein TNCV_1127341 [Trichonephila clavipes]
MSTLTSRIVGHSGAEVQDIKHLILACTKLTSKRRTLMNCLQKNTIAWKGWKGMIQFLAAEGVGGRKMHRWIKAVYDEYSLCRSSVVEWRKTFLEGCE